MTLRQLFLITVPAGLLVAGIASYFAARRSLAPIGRIAAQARRLGAADLNQRIEMPPGADELAQLVDVFNEMLDRLEGAFRAQERFVADVSHELKTPLSALAAEAQLLRQQARSRRDYEEFLENVLEETHRLARTVESFLMLARSDAGFPLRHTEPVPINELVTDAMHRCHGVASQRKVRLMATLAEDPEEDTDPMVTGDRDLLGVMVENVLRNAVRHSPAGGRVEVEVRAGRDDLVIIVRDEGPGIPPEIRERVFDRFVTGPRERTDRGIGIGLAIARGVAELHRGTIRVEDRDGGGCEFFMKLRRADFAPAGV